MSESPSASDAAAPADGLTPLPRCCPSHDDWGVLTEHLVADFPTVPADRVVAELARAKAAATPFGLDSADAFGVAELLARHQLLLLAGLAPDVARLDPERHGPDASGT